MDQYQPIKTYLIYGDSGSGKSSFIKCCGGKTLDNQIPETGGGGDSMTQDSGKIYIIDDEVFGKMQFIDTRGTWDPSTNDNNQIMDNLVKSLVDFSVGSMENQYYAEQQLDGVIYIHNSLSYDRYARDQRITHLSSLVGSNLLSSTLTIMTQYNSLLKMGQIEQDKFHTMVNNKHYQTQQEGHKVKVSEYMFWDSENPIEDQKNQLAQILTSTLKSFDLSNITKSNETIMERAKQLMNEDLVEREVIEHEKIFTKKSKFFKKTKKYTEDKVINIERPDSTILSLLSYSVFTKKIGNFISNPEQKQNWKIEPKFSEKHLSPRSLVSCKLSNETKFQNAIFTQDPLFQHKGDYCECELKYDWQAIQDNISIGRIDLKVEVVIQYKKEQITECEEFVEKMTIKMLPRYGDEKPYLQQAKELSMGKIYQDIKKVTHDIKKISPDTLKVSQDDPEEIEL